MWQLMQSVRKSYVTVITKCERKLLQSVTGITKSDRTLLQSIAVITKCDNIKWDAAPYMNYANTKNYYEELQRSLWKEGYHILVEC